MHVNSNRQKSQISDYEKKKKDKILNNPLVSFIGLCALSINHGNSFLAYPGSATMGEITVYDANNLVRQQRKEMQLFSCHLETPWGKRAVLC